MASPERVYQQLRRMSELSETEQSPMPDGVDMSPAAVTARLRDLADVSELCLMLATGPLDRR